MNVSPFQPRRFVPEQIDLSDPEALAPLLERLDTRLEQLKTVPDLELWLDDAGEFFAAIDEVGSRRYIAMTCQTDDPEREKAYLHLVEVLDPWLKPRRFSLWRRLTSHPVFAQLGPDFQCFRRSAQTEVMLYRDANVPRETELAKLSQQYQKLTGAMTVQFEGKEQTLAQVGRVLEEPDRPRRQAAWEASVNRRLQDAEALETIYNQMLPIREAVAQEAGFSDYRAYAFESKERFDYTPEDCLKFHDSIAEHLVPLTRQIQESRRQEMNLDRLRPWDLAVDPRSRPPLKPFTDSKTFVEKTSRIFRRLDPSLGALFDTLQQQSLLDLENRKGKAPGGYQSTLSESRVPFIFMNAVGVHRDIETLLHEAGHAFHAFLNRTQRLYWYRGAPMEFCEVASMAMELLAAPYLEEFYSEADAKRARRDHLEGIIKFFPWMAVVDAFQHWIYTHPGHTNAERAAEWLRLMNRFGGAEDWSGYEKARQSLWHRQLHIFELPFYYVEYGIAQLGALQLWQRSLQDPKAALAGYHRALALGSSKPLPELFEAAGIEFDFSARTIAPLVKALQREIG